MSDRLASSFFYFWLAGVFDVKYKTNAQLSWAQSPLLKALSFNSVFYPTTTSRSNYSDCLYILYQLCAEDGTRDELVVKLSNGLQYKSYLSVPEIGRPIIYSRPRPPHKLS
jgi:hypothetical protein